MNYLTKDTPEVVALLLILGFKDATDLEITQEDRSEVIRKVYRDGKIELVDKVVEKFVLSKVKYQSSQPGQA